MPDENDLKNPKHPSVPLVPGMTAEMQEAINTALGAAVRKASPWSISIAVVVAVTLVFVGGFLYFNKDFLLQWQKNGLEIRRVAEQHEHCVEEVTSLKGEVRELKEEVKYNRTELAALKNKIASNP